LDNALRKRVLTRRKTDYRMNDTVPALQNDTVPALQNDTVPALQNLYLEPISLRSSVVNGRVTFSLNNGMYIYNQIIPLYMPFHRMKTKT
jgi:hypothetical protein